MKPIALAPLSVLYGAAMKARRVLYQSEVLRIHKLAVPVISIGNLTTGGTGKTPLVEWIARYAAESGRSVCILTRGYRRSNPRERVLVSDGNGILSDVEHSGDEAFMLAEQLNGRVAVIADSDRVAAGRWAIENLKSGVLILDDGFQHLRLARDLDIVAIDATNPFGNGHILPAGILREPISQLARADCAVITRADLADGADDLKAGIKQVADELPVFISKTKIVGLRDFNSNQTKSPGEIHTESFAAICAIGNPESFFAQLRRDGYQLCHTKAFRDHHAYTQNDVDEFLSEAKARTAQALLTTAKDEVKLRGLRIELPCYVADTAVEIEDSMALGRLIDQSI